jgi:hypothetical protein
MLALAPRVLEALAVAVSPPADPAGTSPLLSASTASTCPDPLPKLVCRDDCEAGVAQSVVVPDDLSAQ